MDDQYRKLNQSRQQFLKARALNRAWVAPGRSVLQPTQPNTTTVTSSVISSPILEIVPPEPSHHHSLTSASQEMDPKPTLVQQVAIVGTQSISLSANIPCTSSLPSSSIAPSLDKIFADLDRMQQMIEKTRHSIITQDSVFASHTSTLSSLISRVTHAERQGGLVETRTTKLDDLVNELHHKCNRLESAITKESMLVEGLQTDIELFKMDLQASMNVPPIIKSDEVVVHRQSAVPSASLSLGSFRFQVQDVDKEVRLNIEFMNAKGEWEVLKSIASIAMSELVLATNATNEAVANDAINPDAAQETEAAANQLIASLKLAGSNVTIDPPPQGTTGGCPDPNQEYASQ